MFLRSVRGTLFRQWKKMIMIAFTIALGASLASATLLVMLDVGDKVNQELKTYGANITVVPKAESVLDDLYEIEGQNTSGAYLNEDDLGKIKTIFWAFNIVDFAPFVNAQAELQDGSNVTVVGSWYSHHMKLPTGEELDAGIESLRSWWELKEGSWLSERTASADSRDAMIGVNLAQRLGAKAGSVITVKGADGVSRDFNVTGVFDAGGEEDSYLYTYLANAQEIAGISGKIDSIEVSAITTPDNELAELATKNGPSSLTVSQYEKWYCTAYASSICWQIQEAIPNCIASPVRQVADSEGAILEKTQLLMILITILSLIGAALGICNLVTATVMERSQEIGLMKAIGANNSSISLLVLTEIFITAIIGGIAGFFAGFGFAQIIGHSVFGSAIEFRIMVVPIVAVLVVIVTLIGCIPAIKMLLGLRPTEVLHGR